MNAPRTVIGLLGGIGAGKSFVARRIASLVSARIVNADQLAHDALDACARDGRLTEALGPGFVGPEGRADRAALAERVFGAPPLLRRLEQILHPLVFALITDVVQNHGRGAGPAVLILDVPLLLEVGLDPSCDVLWFVDAAPEVRRERTGRRGLSIETTRLREQNQTPLERKRARADLVLRNDVEDAELDEQLRRGLAALGHHAPTST